MRARRFAIVMGALATGGFYWLAVSTISGVSEPWDSRVYWLLWYPLALLAAATAGAFLGRDGWLAAVVLVLAQLPVMWVASGTGPLIVIGLLVAGALALPAMALALLAGLGRLQ